MELSISLPEGPQRLAVTGAQERYLKIIRESLGVTLSLRNGTLKVSGEDAAVGQAVNVIEQLQAAARRGRPMQLQHVLDTIANVSHDTNGTVGMQGAAGGVRPTQLTSADLEVYVRGRRIHPKTEGQREYLDAILSHDLTFCTGPAGTGKTYLAVAAAVAMLRAGVVRKLVLVRPAVEAGERLGFLPGDMQQKVNPYLRPLLDALHDMMEFDQVQRFLANDIVEVVPLAFMRGRTLNDAVIILDEAQNTTRSQMLMFLTRLGHSGKMVVTGDTSQTDLDDPTQSGLIDAARRLKRVKGIAFVTLSQVDIVRHNLVQRIVDAYGDNAQASRTHPSHE